MCMRVVSVCVCMLCSVLYSMYVCVYAYCVYRYMHVSVCKVHLTILTCVISYCNIKDNVHMYVTLYNKSLTVENLEADLVVRNPSVTFILANMLCKAASVPPMLFPLIFPTKCFWAVTCQFCTLRSIYIIQCVYKSQVLVYGYCMLRLHVYIEA